MAHEVGHAVNYRLNGDSFPSSIRRRFPQLEIGEKAAREELKRASEFIRPLEGESWQNRSNSYVRYRAKHEELMADLFSRATYYRRFWEAIEDEKFQEPEVAASVLLRLGADRDGFESSARSRRLELGPSQAQLATEALTAAQRGARPEPAMRP